MVLPLVRTARVAFKVVIFSGIVGAVAFVIQGLQQTANVSTGWGFRQGMPILYAAACLTASFGGGFGLWVLRLIDSQSSQERGRLKSSK
jgi:hypothetical protein